MNDGRREAGCGAVQLASGPGVVSVSASSPQVLPGTNEIAPAECLWPTFPTGGMLMNSHSF